MEFLSDLIFFFLALGLIFWLVVFLTGVVGAWFLRRRIKKMQRHFEQQFGAQAGADNPYRTTRTGDGISVEDRRSSEEAQQKIFAPDEGEYVEFTEE